MKKRYQYILATIVSTIIAIVVWYSMPKQYGAVTKICDEYKEVDIAVGMDALSAQLRDISGGVNKGINNIEVYCRLLDSEDFARTISRTVVEGKNMTYGQWAMQNRMFFQPKDTAQLILSNITYNSTSKQQALTIRFADCNPIIATQMLDAVMNELQKRISSTKQNTAKQILRNAEQKVESLEKELETAKQAYVDYSDGHMNPATEEVLTKLDQLKNKYLNLQQQLNRAKEEVTRQQCISVRNTSSFAVIKSNALPQEDMSHPFAYIATFVLITLACMKGISLFRQRIREKATLEYGNIFSPWAITLFIWSSMLIMLALFGDSLEAPTTQFYASLSLWIPIFTITSFITFNLLKHETRPFQREGISVNIGWFHILFVISLILSPMYIYKVWQTVSAFDSKDMMNNMRILAVHGEGVGFLVLASVFSQVAFLCAIWAYPKVKKWQVIMTIICCTICSLAIMEKGTMFMVFICGVYVLYEKRTIKLRSIIVLGLIAITLLFIFNVFREGEDVNNTRDTTIFDFIAMYVVSPPVAYCHVRPEVSPQFGVNTFSVVYDYLNRFGFGPFETHEKVQEFVFVPMSTNVYTVMQPFFRDFGYIGVAFFAWIYGIISGIAYRFSKNGNSLAICFYTFLVQLLVLQFYQDNLFLSLSFNIQLLILLVLCTQDRIKVSIVQKGGKL